jgi:hypothetical protein
MEIETVYDEFNPAALLLSDYLALCRLGPTPDEWNTLTLSNNPPRYYRFQRIKSCFKALDLNPSLISTFELGPFEKEFIMSDIEKVEQILAEIFSLDHGVYIDERSPNILPGLFEQFFKLYKNLMDLRKTYADLLATPSHFMIPILAKEEVTKNGYILEDAVWNVLVYLLNKEGLTFKRSELIEQFDFPDVELYEIDLEWT